MKYLKLIRVKHWVKNVLIFVPLLFSKSFDSTSIINTLIGFCSFSLMSSFVYIVNDIKDIEKDRIHPRKRKRPLASGEVKKSTATAIACVLFVASILLNFYIKRELMNSTSYFLLAYFLVNLAYTFGLKDYPIVDVLILSLCYLIRVYYGASIIDVSVSNWLFLTVLNASLFLGLGKRKKEICNNKDSRKVLESYNEAFLDKFQYLTLGLTLVFYSLWASSGTNENFYLSIPLVTIIFMRYCLVLERSEEGDPTTIFYKDVPLILLVIVYIIGMFILLGVF